MENTQIDLTTETQESLENLSPSTKRKWRGQRFKIIGLALFTLCLGFASLLFWSPGMPAEGLFAKLVAVPRDFMDMLFAIFITACLLVSPVVIVYQIIRLTRGAPKAPTEPTETVRRFYSKTLREDVAGLDPEAYIYLLNQAKAEFVDVDGFVRQCRKVVEALADEIRRQLKQQLYGERRYEVKEIREIGSNKNLRTYEVDIQATMLLSSQGGVLPKPVGSVLIQERCTIASIGGRWYLTSGKWTGRLVPLHV